MHRLRSNWELIIERDPGHSQRYIERFKNMAAQGVDLYGEARFMDAMMPRHARILDAGCGPGRLGGELARHGHTVVGVDIDPALIAEARHEHPDCTWVVGDIADLELEPPAPAEYDGILCAGNVMTFLHPGTRRASLATMHRLLAPTGRLAVGFGAGRGYEFQDFFMDAEAVGLVLQLGLSTWDLLPFPGDSNFVVAVFGKGATTTQR